MKPVYRADDDEVVLSSDENEESQLKKITENHFHEFLNLKNSYLNNKFSPFCKSKNNNPFKLISDKDKKNLSYSFVVSQSRRQGKNEDKKYDYLPQELLGPTQKNYATNKSLVDLSSNLLYKYDKRRDIKESRNLIEILKSFRNTNETVNSKLRLQDLHENSKPVVLDLGRSNQIKNLGNFDNQSQTNKVFKKKALK